MAFLSLRMDANAPRWPFDRSETRKIARQAAPIAMIAMVNMGMSITDTLMAASLGAEALAGVAIASDYYSVLFYLLAGTIGGLVPLYAAAAARGETGRRNALCGSGWVVALGGACLLAPVLWLAPQVLHGIGVDPVLISAAGDYCAVMTCTLFPNAVAALYRARLTALERPGLLLQISLAALPLNALGNWVFMSGIEGWGGLGATGLAVSSLIVWVGIASALVVQARRAEGRGSRLLIDLSAVREIIRVGLPIGVMALADVGLFLGATIYVGIFAVEHAAAHAIAIRLAGVSYVLSVGLNQATMVRVARQDTGAARRTVIASALSLALVASGLLGVGLSGVALGMWQTAGAAGSDFSGVFELAAPAVMLLALMEFISPVGATADGVLRGQRDTRAAMTFSLAGNWLIAAPMILYLTQYFELGVTGIWLGLTAGVVTTACLIVSRLPRHWHDQYLPTRNGAVRC